jgi:hypothetical protein
MDNIVNQNAAASEVAAATISDLHPTEHYEHLPESCRREAALSNVVRIELIKRGVVIEHPAYKLAMDYAHWILSQPPGTPGRGMLLMGEPGVGKSTFGEEIVRSGKGRIVMISAEGARSMRELYGRVLQSFDGPVARSMHTPDRELAVIRLFKAFNVRGFAVDEIQDLTKGSQREHQQVLMGIKYLSNIARIPLFCLGTPDAAKAFYVEKSLEKRLRPFTLPQWKLDQSFADLIKAVEQTLPLRKPSAIRNEATLRYLLDISGGSLREIMARITCAAVRAILSGEEALTLQGLKDAESAPPRDGEAV